MPKLVVLSDGQAGKSCEITAEKVTIGRVEENSFQIPEASVSSHHCEVFLRGNDVVVKDLNSTNGSFINGEKIAEAVLKPGQTLRLGQIDLKLDTPAAPAPAAKKTIEPGASQHGVRLGEGDTAQKTVSLDKNPAFAKKSNKAGLIFIVIGGVLALAIIVFIVLAVLKFGQIGQDGP